MRYSFAVIYLPAANVKVVAAELRVVSVELRYILYNEVVGNGLDRSGIDAVTEMLYKIIIE